ncbi:trans-resveratrol di-O-methyltransferase-like [Silene latifolia]|uniref:trans-resveratrol di-O-methyltransferase-like n=1 Tax=Silene latifolia TaxID=37657 RepID=UPI003D77AC04
MDTSIIISSDHKNELLNAQTHIWTHIFHFLNSMALKCAIQLQIPDAIHKHGKPMTLSELVTALALSPTKAASLYRIMRLLVHSNFLSKSKLVNGEETFDLTVNSKLLLKDHPMTLAPFTLALLDPILTEPAHYLASWFQNNDESPFHTAHGIGVWDYAGTEMRFNEYFKKAMASDAKFVGDILLGNIEFKGLFEGVGSLVDVGGGTGTMANAIAKGHPSMKCTVFDLPHVVEGLQNNGLNLDYVGGDMFEA